MSLTYALRNLTHEDIDIIYRTLPFIKTLSPNKGTHATQLSRRQEALAEALTLARDSFSLTHESLRRKSRVSSRVMQESDEDSDYEDDEEETRVFHSQKQEQQTKQNHGESITNPSANAAATVPHNHQTYPAHAPASPEESPPPRDDSLAFQRKVVGGSSGNDGSVGQPHNEDAEKERARQKKSLLSYDDITGNNSSSGGDESMARNRFKKKKKSRSNNSGKSPRKSISTPDLGSLVDRARGRVAGTAAVAAAAEENRRPSGGGSKSHNYHLPHRHHGTTAEVTPPSGQPHEELVYSEMGQVPPHLLPPGIIPIIGTDEYNSPSTFASSRRQEGQSPRSQQQQRWVRNKTSLRDGLGRYPPIEIEYLRPGDGLFSSTSSSSSDMPSLNSFSSSSSSPGGSYASAQERAHKRYGVHGHQQAPAHMGVSSHEKGGVKKERRLPPTPASSPPPPQDQERKEEPPNEAAAKASRMATRKADLKALVQTMFSVPPMVPPYDPVRDYLPTWLGRTYNYWRWTLRVPAHDVPERYAVWISLHLRHATLWYHVDDLAVLADAGKFGSSRAVNEYILRRAAGHIKVQEEIARLEFNALVQPEHEVPVLVFNATFLRIFEKVRHFYHPDRLAVQYYDRVAARVRKKLDVSFVERYGGASRGGRVVGGREGGPDEGGAGVTDAVAVRPARGFIALEELMTLAEQADDTYRPVPVGGGDGGKGSSLKMVTAQPRRQF